MLEKFFRRQPKKDAHSEGLKPPQLPSVPYDPSLILALTHQHRSLSMLLVEASSAAEEGSYEEVGDILEQFANALAEHLRQESVRLHPYLAEHIKGEDGDVVLKEMQSHSALIRHSVVGFLKRYSNTPVSAGNVAEFQQDIEAMGDEFSQVTERAEAIFYTLYMPPEAY
ncbi:MAG TPA: hemerythrin domain-containing protein [Gammaproteobacteria bacterium]|nr:hemerythrin domain-containing protein [Gammaproteobacteria bacterium]